MKMFRKSKPQKADVLTFPGGSVTIPTGDSSGGGTDFYLHEPAFAESVYLGKLYYTPMGMGWFTSLSENHVEWRGSESLMSYLRKLADGNNASTPDSPRYMSWIASSTGHRYLPEEVASLISGAKIHGTMVRSK